MQAKDDCFFTDYEKSIKLVVLDGTEDLNAIYQEIYGRTLQVRIMDPQTLHSTLRRMALYLNPASMYYSPMQLELLTFEIPAADFGDDLTADIFNGVQDAGGYICKI